MKMVIQTQFVENYGAHDWDGEGECPQHWKNKFGDTYIMDITIQQAQDDSFMRHVLDNIEHKSEYTEEYILSWSYVDDIDFAESNHVEEWESPIYLEYAHGGLAAKQYFKLEGRAGFGVHALAVLDDPSGVIQQFRCGPQVAAEAARS